MSKVSTLFVQQKSFPFRAQGWPMGSRRVGGFGGFGLQGFTKDSNCLTKAQQKNQLNQKHRFLFLFENWSLGKSSHLLTLNERLVNFVSMRFSWLCLLSPEFIHARIMFGFASLGRWAPKTGGMDDEIVGSWKCWCWPFLSMSYDETGLSAEICWRPTWLVSCRYPTCALA